MKLKLVVAASLFAAVVVVSSAAAKIVVQRSIAGVKLNMTQAKVKSILGRPNSVVRGTNEFGRWKEFRYFRLAVTFQGEANVTNLSTSRTNERTANDIGVGSTKAEVRAKIRGVRCDRLTCWVGRFLPGSKVTTFFLKRGLVSRVGLGLVID
ncbi:MAG: hypothetical protein M3R70_11460 [Actinomycetota bacterium]|nr:hypothetical protein [Actinomycetota bacterium]